MLVLFFFYEENLFVYFQSIWIFKRLLFLSKDKEDCIKTKILETQGKNQLAKQLICGSL